jgi:hypothetical protein
MEDRPTIGQKDWPPPLVRPLDLAALPPVELGRMAAAACRLAACRQRLAIAGHRVIDELTRDQPLPYVHYPRGDVYDFSSHAQYYFHCHRDGEQGHFHTFLRPRGMPPGIRPADPADWRGLADNDALSHLVAVSLDERGEAIRLFTTNRWVTAETWYRAADVCAMLPCFHIGHDHPSALANDWITALLALFRPQIEGLLEERDACLERQRGVPSGVPPFEDRDLEVTSHMSIDVAAQIAAVLRAVAA